NAADGALGGGTMSRAGVKCPCCSGVMTRDDLRYAGRAGALGTVMTAVVVDGPFGKEYRRPTEHELTVGHVAISDGEEKFAGLPFGLPKELIPLGGSRAGGGSPFTPPQYGLVRWCDLFTSRQLLTIGTFLGVTRRLLNILPEQGYAGEWREALYAYLSLSID